MSAVENKEVLKGAPDWSLSESVNNPTTSSPMVSTAMNAWRFDSFEIF